MMKEHEDRVPTGTYEELEDIVQRLNTAYIDFENWVGGTSPQTDGLEIAIQDIEQRYQVGGWKALHVREPVEYPDWEPGMEFPPDPDDAWKVM
jgi:hypothetical protein